VFTCIIHKIMDFFQPDYTSDLEKYIESRKPTDAVDLERIMFEYSLKRKGGL
jgi:hypothetical protein